MSADLIERLRDPASHKYGIGISALLDEAAAALEASATEGERRSWLAAVDALDEIAKAMEEKAEALRSPDPFAVATSEEADAAVHGWVLKQAATLLRERISEAPVREPSHEPR